MLAVQAEGMRLTTVEGMAEPGELSPLQAAFLRHRAFQCGFCTPGFLASAGEILNGGRRHSRAELRELLAGNICRCTGYEPIVEALLECQG
jgi:aerobic-type carbon monoxide dehydrogenase small subunit (CoxS/CutS family)